MLHTPPSELTQASLTLPGELNAAIEQMEREILAEHGAAAFAMPRHAAVVHEASHAVVAAHEGFTVHRVGIHEKTLPPPFDVGAWVGSARIEGYWNINDDTAATADLTQARILVAGYCGEFCAQIALPGSSVLEYVATHWIAAGAAFKLDPDAFDHNDEGFQTNNAFAESIWTERVWKATCAILSGNQGPLKRLCELLNEKETVEGEELQAILKDVVKVKAKPPAAKDNAKAQKAADTDDEGLPPGPPPADTFPAALLDPPGLVGEIATWITDTAIYPQKALSIGAALTCVGTAAGRKLAGPTRSGTHLNMIGLARSGAGKDHPRSQILIILAASGLAGCIGPSEFASASAIYKLLNRTPLALCAMDEIGAFFKRINSRNASGFEAAIGGTLRTIWGSSFKPLPVPEWASKELQTVYAPALSIFGVDTLAQFYGSLTGADIINGGLNRCALIESWGRPDERIPTLDPTKVPEPIKQGLWKIYTSMGADIFDIPDPNERIPTHKQLAITEDAEVIRKALVVEIQRQGDADTALEPFLARVAENAIRIATILAIGCGRMTVEAADMTWAREFMLWSSRRMVEGAGLYVANSATQAMANEIKRVLKEMGGKQVAAWKLKRALAHKYERSKLDDVLVSLRESRTVLRETSAPSAKGGTQGVFYTLLD